jgi:hypothetical protein
MAKLKIDLSQFTGTFDNITVYEMNDNLYARKKSSLTGDRVKTEPEFKKTMENASLMARASRMGSAIYKIIYPQGKTRDVYKEITGKVVNLLKGGYNSEEEIRLAIVGQYKK